MLKLDVAGAKERVLPKRVRDTVFMDAMAGRWGQGEGSIRDLSVLQT